MARWKVGMQVVGRNIPEDHLETEPRFGNGDFGIIVAKHGAIEGNNGRFAVQLTVRYMSARNVLTTDIVSSEELVDVGNGVLGFVTPEETTRARLRYYQRMAERMAEDLRHGAACVRSAAYGGGWRPR